MSHPTVIRFRLLLAALAAVWFLASAAVLSAIGDNGVAPTPTPLDSLHIALIAGLLSFLSAVSAHVITKYRLSGRFVPTTDFSKAMEATLQKMIDHCELLRAKCPLMVVSSDIREIKEIQRRRTLELARRHARDDEIWRIVMTKLSVPVEEQNRLLAKV